MMRLLLAAVAGSAFMLAFAVAEEKKGEEKKADPNQVMGTFESYKNGTLTVRVKDKTMEYKVPEDFKTTVWGTTGDPRRDVLARESFRDLKAGTPITLGTAEGNRVTTLTIGTARGGDKEAPRKDAVKDKEPTRKDSVKDKDR